MLSTLHDHAESTYRHPVHPPISAKPPTRLEDIKLTFDTYGEKSSGLSPEKIQAVMEWLTLSLLDCGYYGHTYVIWCANPDPDPVLERKMKAGMRRNQPVVLYRCGGRTMPPPEGCYWRLMPEHPSMRVYQLEVREAD